MSNQIQQISVTQIKGDPTNPRMTENKPELKALSESIKEQGLINPITVRPNGSDKTFIIIAGHRRFEASKMAGIKTIACIVHKEGDFDILQAHENIQRKNLHPVEEAEAFLKLAEKDEMSIAKIAAKAGKTKGYVAERLPLAKLPEKVKKEFIAGKCCYETALAIALLDPTLQQKAYDSLNDPNDDWSASAIKRQYHLVLNTAPFNPKDEKYLPVTKTFEAAKNAEPIKSCTGCEFNTASMVDLFGNSSEDARCTNVGCFNTKCQAHLGRLHAKYTKAQIEVEPATDYGSYDSKFMNIDAPMDSSKGTTTWASFLKGDIDFKIVLKNHKITRYAEKADIRKLAAKIKPDKIKGDEKLHKIAETAGRSATSIEEKAKRENSLIFKKMIDVGLDKIKPDKVKPEQWLEILKETIDRFGGMTTQALNKRRGVDAHCGSESLLKEATDLESALMIIFESHLFNTYPQEPKGLKSWFKLLSLDLESIQKEAVALIEEGKKPKTKVGSTLPPRKAPKKK